MSPLSILNPSITEIVIAGGNDLSQLVALGGYLAQ